ncbi:MAG: MBL fold metallo-hydrolase [Acidimicrobiales bacterium]
MIEPRRVHPDITVLPTFHDLPGIGVLTINSFVLAAEQPLIVDTGTANDSDRMVPAIVEAVGGGGPRWLWMTHTDADHIGSLHHLLDLFPELTLVTNYTGLVKLSTHTPVAVDRVRLLNPGESLGLGDRTITAARPPRFDAPETTGFHDPVSRALFSSDCLGAILPAGVHDLIEVTHDELLEAQTLWTAIDTPWVAKVDRGMLAGELDAIRDLAPSMILIGHLPATLGIVERQLDGVRAAPDGEPFVDHDHASSMSMIGR